MGNPTHCGLRVTSYIENSTGAMVPYVNLLEMPDYVFYLDVMAPPVTQPAGPVSLTVTTYLDAYPAVTATIDITIDFLCTPTVGLILGTPPATLLFTYDLSTAGPQAYTVTSI